MKQFKCVGCIISSSTGTSNSKNSAVLLLSLNPEFPTDNEANPAEHEIWGMWVAITVGFGVLVGWGFLEVLQVGTVSYNI